MFIPPMFQISQSDALEIIVRNDFAVLVDLSDKTGRATHLPLLLEKGADDAHKLYGHMAKANPQCAMIGRDARALAIFSGPHGYISPSWYEEPSKNVPTWNYQAVHVSGYLHALDPAEAEQSMENLNKVYEKTWTMEILPAASKEKMLKFGITPFVMEIDQIEGKAKLSQNRPKADVQAVISQLRKAGNTALAEQMLANTDIVQSSYSHS